MMDPDADLISLQPKGVRYRSPFDIYWGETTETQIQPPRGLERTNAPGCVGGKGFGWDYGGPKTYLRISHVQDRTLSLVRWFSAYILFEGSEMGIENADNAAAMLVVEKLSLMKRTETVPLTDLLAARTRKRLKESEGEASCGSRIGLHVD